MWQGSRLLNSVTGAVTTSKNLTKLSATNSVFAAQSTADYRTDTWFFGTVTYNPTDPVITVWHEVLKTQQTTTNGSIIRIQYGRALVMAYEAYTIPRQTFTVTLTGAVDNILIGAGVLVSLLLLY